MTTSPWHLGVDSVGALPALCRGLLVPWEGLSALMGQHMAAAQDGLHGLCGFHWQSALWFPKYTFESLGATQEIPFLNSIPGSSVAWWLACKMSSG